MSSSVSNLSPLEALKAGFRRACVRRLVGDEDGAIQALKNEIPVLVVAWAKVSALDPSEKKAKLKEMFDDESARADELATAFDLFAGRFEARIVAIMKQEIGQVVSELRELYGKGGLAVEASQSGLAEDEVRNQSEELVQPEQVKRESEERELDPPRGTGLKFDEIEKMIDEVPRKNENLVEKCKRLVAFPLFLVSYRT